MEQTVYLFVKKIHFFLQINKNEIYSEGIYYLTQTILVSINEKNLSNTLSFLEITGLTKKFY